MNKKSLTAIILSAVIALSFVACKGKPASPEEPSSAAQTQIVTDKNGKAVTNKDGTPVTEEVTTEKAVADVSEKESEANERSTSKKSGDKKETTTEKQTTTQPVSKVKNPNTVEEIKVSDITENSLTLSWKGVTCDFYELEYKRASDDRWETVDDNLKQTSIQIEGLTSLTNYSFRLRAIIKHKAGNSESAWREVSAKTKEQVITRKIKINVQLPARTSDKDKLILYIKEDGKKREKLTSADVAFDGSIFTYKTEKEYKGVVTIQAKLKNTDAERKVKTDKDTCYIDISGIGIDVIIGEDDD